MLLAASASAAFCATGGEKQGLRPILHSTMMDVFPDRRDKTFSLVILFKTVSIPQLLVFFLQIPDRHREKITLKTNKDLFFIHCIRY